MVRILEWRMDVKDLLRRSGFRLPFLHQISGVPLGYLKQLSAGNRRAGAQTRARLAAAFREHAAHLIEDASRLELDE